MSAGQKFSPLSEGRGEPKDPKIALVTADCRVVGDLGVIAKCSQFQRGGATQEPLYSRESAVAFSRANPQKGIECMGRGEP